MVKKNTLIRLKKKERELRQKIIIEAASPDANIIFGTTIDESMTDQIKITVIATGFDAEDIRAKLGISTETSYKKDSLEMSRPIVTSSSVGDSDDEDEDDLDQDFTDTETSGGDPWGKPKMSEDRENKYDIPAFLRGK